MFRGGTVLPPRCVTSACRNLRVDPTRPEALLRATVAQVLEEGQLTEPLRDVVGRLGNREITFVLQVNKECKLKPNTFFQILHFALVLMFTLAAVLTKYYVVLYKPINYIVLYFDTYVERFKQDL
jgi:hypothetical protein